MLDANISIGHHLVVGFAGTLPGDSGVEILRAQAQAGEIGGAILFSYNIESPDQLKKLTRYIASWEVPEINRPLLIAVDQEGGTVQRLSQDKGFHGWPSAARIGTSPFYEAYEAQAGLPQELLEYGVNLNFAPVIDVAQGPSSIIASRERSFGEDPNFVFAFAARSISEHRSRNLIATVKHFPGLGACTGDTHEDLIDGTQTWSRKDLLPYQALLANGGIDAVMSTHMVHSGLEASDMPLTFSRSVMRGMLRDELGFEGVLFTDDLGMGSIVRHYDLEAVVEKSLVSGHDMLVFGQNSAASSPGSVPAHKPIDQLFSRATAAVRSAVDSGRLSESELKQSDKRIWRMRGLLQKPRAGKVIPD